MESDKSALRNTLAHDLINGNLENAILLISEIKGWSPAELGALAVYLSPLGGTGWPTALVRLGSDLSWRDTEGQGVLSNCIHGALPGQKQALETWGTFLEFLELGADPNVYYMSHASVTCLALHYGLKDFVLALLLAGADTKRLEPSGELTLADEFMRSDFEWAARILSLLRMRAART
jgi:hypothetical protein